ncbi:hypothetical protein AAFF_G00141230 [Aldrovandia affinis]|uniref:Uncharacterized protein n=1 Tax=Aldrovandia affinis TaxID=143900 RepID=A0AAD7TCF7_9TELE|nr:hypothetical protein AAFF_G00141230 [Aldrovandia affinis]
MTAAFTAGRQSDSARTQKVSVQVFGPGPGHCSSTVGPVFNGERRSAWVHHCIIKVRRNTCWLPQTFRSSGATAQSFAANIGRTWQNRARARQLSFATGTVSVGLISLLPLELPKSCQVAGTVKLLGAVNANRFTRSPLA